MIKAPSTDIRCFGSITNIQPRRSRANDAILERKKKFLSKEKKEGNKPVNIVCSEFDENNSSRE
jgi:hypothetical protein